MSELSSGQAELVVIGAGPGGYAAAFHAADRGMKVTLVDADSKPGGVCLHRGCIPSKALLHVARVITETREAEQWGVKFARPEIDLDKLRRWKADLVERLAGGVTQMAKRRGVKLVQARARFVDSQAIQLHALAGQATPQPDRIAFDHAIIATGSIPAIPASLQVDDPRVLDSTTALELAEVPARLLVIGGGYIGLELGTVYAALGSRVTVVELTDGLLPGVDRDLVRPLERRLERVFEAIHLSTEVARIEPQRDAIRVELQGQDVPQQQPFDRVLIAVGRMPNTQNLGLENTRVQLTERGFVKVDRRGRTDDANISAIGDVVGEPMLAHKAMRDAKVASEAIAGESAAFDNVAIPAVVFTDPEIAWCGLTETQAQAENRDIRVAKCPWSASGRAQTLGRTDGLTKLIFDPHTQRLLGMGIVGVGAGELIAEGVVAIEMGALARDVAKSIHPHPTMSETIAESAEALLGHATHLYDAKR